MRSAERERHAADGPASAVAAAPMRDRLVAMKMVEDRVGFKKTAIYQMIADDLFPKPIKVCGRARWSEREIDRWIADQIAARDVGTAVGSPGDEMAAV